MIKAELLGQEELAAALRRLPLRVARRLVPRAVNAAAAPIVKTAKANCPVLTGTLKKSIRRKTKRDKGRVRAWVSFKMPGRIYAHLAHDGFTGRDGGFKPGTPFLTRAFTAHQAEALDRMNDKLGKEIVKEGRKL